MCLVRRQKEKNKSVLVCFFSLRDEEGFVMFPAEKKGHHANNENDHVDKENHFYTLSRYNVRKSVRGHLSVCQYCSCVSVLTFLMGLISGVKGVRSSIKDQHVAFVTSFYNGYFPGLYKS